MEENIEQRVDLTLFSVEDTGIEGSDCFRYCWSGTDGGLSAGSHPCQWSRID